MESVVKDRISYKPLPVRDIYLDRIGTFLYIIICYFHLLSQIF